MFRLEKKHWCIRWWCHSHTFRDFHDCKTKVYTRLVLSATVSCVYALMTKTNQAGSRCLFVVQSLLIWGSHSCLSQPSPRLPCAESLVSFCEVFFKIKVIVFLILWSYNSFFDHRGDHRFPRSLELPMSMWMRYCCKKRHHHQSRHV